MQWVQQQAGGNGPSDEMANFLETKTVTSSKASERLSRAASAVVETLEQRQLLAGNPTASLSASLLAFNTIASGYSGSASSPQQVLTLTNVGGSTLTIPNGGITVANDPSVSTADAGDFAVTNLASVPSSLAPGQSASLDLTFAAQSTGLHSAFLQIQSNDPANPVEKVALRGLGTVGTGGNNEPSLAAILREYEIPTIVGDGPNDANAFSGTYYPENPDPSSQEVPMQRLVKAGAGPVTITPLASFNSSVPTTVRFGYYTPGDPTDTTELFTIGQADAQTVNPTPLGATNFDPGSSTFSLYAAFPGTSTPNGALDVHYSETAFNTLDQSHPQKFRFFPMENSNGSVVPDTYIVAAEDYNNPAYNSFDNFVGIISNVEPASDATNAPVLGLTNPDALPGSDVMVFNRIQSPNPDDPQGFTDIVHDTGTLQINNSGDEPLVINSLTLSDATNWQLVNPPAPGTSIAPGGTSNITVKFVAQSVPPNLPYNETNDTATTNGTPVLQAGGVWNGTLTINSNDPVNPARTVPLAGYWQKVSEDEMEPGVQTLTNLMLGYGTTIANDQQPDYANNGTTQVDYGEEVNSAYWEAADPTQPVTVLQYEDWSSQYDLTQSPPVATTPQTFWYAQGNSGALNHLLTRAVGNAQTLFPNPSGGTGLMTASFTPGGAFGFNVDGEYSDSSLNLSNSYIQQNGRSGLQFRFYPVRDGSGNLVPNTWLAYFDYGFSQYENYDYQDLGFIVTNMRPLTQAPAPADTQATGGAAGILLQWQPVVDSSLQGYNVYRSSSANGSYTKLNSSLVTTASYLDATASPGAMSYYRITAVDSSGESEAANASAAALASNTMTTTLGPTADASVQDGASANTNFGSAPDLQVKVSNAGYNHEAYISFNLSGISGNVTSATLNLYGDLETAGAGYTVNVIPTTGSWSENTITWNTKPADGTTVLASTTVSGTTGQWYTLDLTSYIQSQLAAGQTTLSLAIEGAAFTTGGYADFNSREASSNNPQLVVTTAPAGAVPATPSSLTVTGTTAASVSLSWAPSSGATSYIVLRKGPTDSGFVSIGTPTGTSFTDSTVSPVTTYAYEVQAANSTGTSSPTATVNATTGAGATATFVKSDTTTGGNWSGVYGADGYEILDGSSSLPAYAQVAASGENAYVWQSPTSDGRAPQNSAGSSSRTASCFYSGGATGSSFTLDVNLTDGNAHQVGLYLLDWDARGRAESVQITDASSGAVLSTQSVSNFTNGVYLVWNLSGHIKITITCTGGVNAVASGLFFGPAPAVASATAAYVKSDTTTGGTWTGAYGTDGYSVFNEGTALPTYAQVTPYNNVSYTWASSTADGRALQDSPSASARIAACDYSTGGPGTSFGFDINLTDGKTHQVALYLLDWDRQGRVESIQVTDAVSGTVLDTRTASNFGNGLWLVWNISGHVKITITCTGGLNAVASGLFFGTTSTTNAPAAPTGLAATAAASSIALKWNASTGATGYAILRKGPNDAGYVQVGTSSTPSYTDSTVAAGSVYAYEVEATNASGTSTASTSAFSAPTGSAAAAFARSDTSTSGNWSGAYGSDGYTLLDGPAALPAYAQVTAAGENAYVWQSPTTDARAPRNSPGSSSRTASCYYAPGGTGTSFTLNLNLTDGNVHQVALYLLDFDYGNRAESVQITDATSGAVLSTQNASNFTNGDYLVWNLSGNVKITITCTGGLNAVASALLFAAPQ